MCILQMLGISFHSISFEFSGRSRLTNDESVTQVLGPFAGFQRLLGSGGNLLQIIYHPIPQPHFIQSSQRLFVQVFRFGIFVSVALLIGDYERKSTKYFMLLFLFCKHFSLSSWDSPGS